MMLHPFHRWIGLLFGTALVVSVAALPGCSDNGTGSGGVPFPNDVGTCWIYASYDSLASKDDTVTVVVVAKKSATFLGRTQLITVWNLSSSKGVETEYVTTSGDSVWVWDVAEGENQELTFVRLAYAYVFPLTIGKEWPDSWCGEKAQVAEKRMVKVPGEGLLPGYLITHQGFCLNVIFSETRMFVPGVGLTSAHWFWDDFASRNETWELLGFEVGHVAGASSQAPLLAPLSPSPVAED
jgi:hypothetical protein